MARRAFPRPTKSHEITAAEILRRHAARTGQSVTLPVPIEMIIERTYHLEVRYEPIDEPPGMMILGALAPRERRIVINAAHERLLGDVLGPEKFTLAHELAHWVYDAENPDQMTLGFEDDTAEVFCYHRDSPNLPDSDRVREVNANKLAAALLLPEDLIRRIYVASQFEDLRELAVSSGVSRQTLRIRLETLGLIDATSSPPGLL